MPTFPAALPPPKPAAAAAPAAQGDLLLVDDGVCFAVQNGVTLSRSEALPLPLPFPGSSLLLLLLSAAAVLCCVLLLRSAAPVLCCALLLRSAAALCCRAPPPRCTARPLCARPLCIRPLYPCSCRCVSVHARGAPALWASAALEAPPMAAAPIHRPRIRRPRHSSPHASLCAAMRHSCPTWPDRPAQCKRWEGGRRHAVLTLTAALAGRWGGGRGGWGRCAGSPRGMWRECGLRAHAHRLDHFALLGTAVEVHGLFPLKVALA